MKSARLHCLIAALAFLSVGTTSCEDDDDDECGDHDDDDDFEDDDFDDDFDDDDDFQGCSTAFIIAQWKGRVVVLLTDRPRPDIQSAHVTIEDVVLESREADPESLYRWDAGHRVDLISLRGTADTRVHEVLTSRGGVRPAAYDSIRFTVRDPSFILSSGEAVDAQDIDLAGRGNIAIDFAEPLLLGPSDVAYIVLDFDLERSLPDREAKDGSRWTLRPIVLVDVLRKDVVRAVRAPTDLSGMVVKVGRKGDFFDLQLSGGRGASRVRLAPEGAVIRGEGLEPPAAGIRVGSRVLARGSWTADGSLLAESIILGDVFEANGLVREVSPAAAGCVGARILVSAGQALEGDLHVEACSGTLVSFDRIGPAGLADLREGMMVAVVGLAGSSPAPAAIIDVKQLAAALPGGALETSRAAGTVIAVDERSGIIALASGADVREIEAGGASILLVEEAAGAFRQRVIPFQEIEDGMEVEEGNMTAGRREGRLLVVTPAKAGPDSR